MPTNVTLFLKGSLVLFAKEGQPEGSVRILRVPPPNHVLTLTYQEQPPGGTFGQDIPVSPVRDALNIEVQNTAHPNISLRNKNANINRKASPTHQDSFKWFVDLENAELYNTPIGVKKSAFKQILTFNSGELFSASPLSHNSLLYQKGIHANYETFGFVAVRIGVEFSQAERVVFRNGGDVVFDSAQKPDGTNFRIKLDHDATVHPPVVTDANHYYKAVGSGIPQEERILFASIRQAQLLQAMLEEAELTKDEATAAELKKIKLDPPAGPEAACFPAYLGRSTP